MISLSPIVSHHAVLQRDREVKIWGEITCRSDRQIHAECLLMREESVSCMVPMTLIQMDETNHYSFEVGMPPRQAGGPYTICVRYFAAEDQEVIEQAEVTDVYFGDVYLIAGQSNIEFRLKNDTEYKDHTLTDFAYPQIRSFRVSRVDYPGAKPENNPDNESWLVLSEETAERFSAVSYYFARSIFLSSEEKIPIGLIDANRGGTSALTWVDEACLQNEETLKSYLDEYQELLASLDFEQNRCDNEVYYVTLEVYNKEAEKLSALHLSLAEIEKRIGLFPWPPPAGPFAYRSPCVLYHTMIQPYLQFELKAVLYYQGEEDVDKSAQYKTLLRCLILFWRKAFGQENLPFVLVQIAPYEYLGETGDMAGYVRLAQSDLSKELPNVSLVVTTDCGDKDNIHPPSKRTIGERLSLSVQKNVLGRDVSAQGPVCKSIRAVDGGGLVVAFETEGTGLVFGREKGEPPRGFSVTPDGHNWFLADAQINQDDLFLISQEVSRPIGARYAFGGYVPANLYSRLALPAVPFIAWLSEEKPKHVGG